MNMRRPIKIAIVTAGWLLASPSVHLPLGASSWFEVGPPLVMAAKEGAKRVVKHPPHRILRRKAARRPIRTSSTPPGSNQPGLYPFNPVVAVPNTAPLPTVTQAPPVPGYPGVPSMAILPRGDTGGAGLETYSDKVVRCTHQAAAGGLPGDQQGMYVTTCAGQ
jgi:hypothetical protein